MYTVDENDGRDSDGNGVIGAIGAIGAVYCVSNRFVCLPITFYVLNNYVPKSTFKRTYIS